MSFQVKETFEEFESNFGPGLTYASMSPETIAKYSGAFALEGDSGDVICYMWENFGLRTYGDGLLWFVNPDDYNDLAHSFSEVSSEAVVFARTATGCLLMTDIRAFGDDRVVQCLNVHKGESDYVNDQMLEFFLFTLQVKNAWEFYLNGKLEFTAIKKHGPIKEDKCIGYVPALALGGSEKIGQMQVLSMREYVAICAQALS